MQSVLNLIISIVRTPAILVALIAILGLALQKKSFPDIVSGGIKTFIGFLVLTGGAGIVTGSLDPLGKMFIHAFHVQGVIPNNEAIVGVVLVQYGTTTALIMLLSMIINVLLARFTSFKYIYLSGHVMLYMAAMLAVLLQVAGFETWSIILLGGLVLGVADTAMPAMVQPFVSKVTKSNTVALAHTGDFGYWISGIFAKAFGNDKHSTEDLNIPKSVSFLRDSTVAITITMAVIYVILAICAGPAYVGKMSGDMNYIVYSIVQAGTFAAGVYVILSGVRLILNEIIPAFKGISEKLVPNAVPALDCPIVFPYAPNAVIVGFFASFIGGVVSMLLMISFHLVIVIPGVVAHFMCGATSGVIGNAVGGRRGAIIGSFFQGIVISFLPLALIPVLGKIGFGNAMFSDADFGVWGSLIGWSGQLGGQIAILVVVALIIIAFTTASIIVAKRSKKITE
ncbi:PTS ascorbate transporter subunit IIC [Pediococcus acidilactici]|uniref:PTS ascorbate transporter subunit IIC n=1 Tax=Pediococcus acidilactici TaxID=1254 RepID=UPI00071AF811|nr:PTS ascorbate transporter subunit IIC [Pediococcus acidilactici]KAF0369067.1 PTS ascorbate transporter subunit IIC [Pediococcus acidilactici]KAF0515717.1 PTS ascorbate transporter subunit IIC [Pediococcus acidilactici]KSV56949.1 PTS beta-glucoside transporter subunit IIBC [Pediococcus acidilactici]MBW9300704.1 PTS ascorbate transporter subunit IIC [Pediococcus acidilactici]MCT3037487.1 PTS ascorbate transporter subunit IIC [Pediococcus acidilactici]